MSEHSKVDFTVSYDRKDWDDGSTVDWGLTISEWQGEAWVCIVGETPESAADLLRCAANAVEAQAA